MNSQLHVRYRSVLVIFVILFTLAACGLSEEEIAATSVAATATAASPTPTKTETPMPTMTHTSTMTPTPTITPTITPSPTSSDFTVYYPHEDNRTWWYADYLDDELVSITYISVVEYEKEGDGNEFFSFEIRSINSSRVVSDYMEVSAEQGLLRESVTLFEDGSSDINSFTPPMPLVQFPFEVGNRWTYGEDIPDRPTYLYEVVSKEDISVIAGDYDDCYLVHRTVDGTLDYKTYYCPEVGPAIKEFFSENVQTQSEGIYIVEYDLIYSELIATTNARLILDSMQKNGSDCVLHFEIQGFPESEPSTFKVTVPGGEEYIQGAGIPIKSGDIFSYPIHAQDPVGLWFWELEGTEHDAVFIYYWKGECSMD
jgi:hypothetical protein